MISQRTYWGRGVICGVQFIIVINYTLLHGINGWASKSRHIRWFSKKSYNYVLIGSYILSTGCSISELNYTRISGWMLSNVWNYNNLLTCKAIIFLTCGCNMVYAISFCGTRIIASITDGFGACCETLWLISKLLSDFRRWRGFLARSGSFRNYQWHFHRFIPKNFPLIDVETTWTKIFIVFIKNYYVFFW